METEVCQLNQVNMQSKLRVRVSYAHAWALGGGAPPSNLQRSTNFKIFEGTMEEWEAASFSE